MFIQTVALYVVLALGIPGNVLVVVTVYLNRCFHTFHFFLLASLACCDVMILGFAVVPRMVCWQSGEDWSLGDTWCMCVAFTGRTLYLSTVSHLCAVSYERYKAIVKEPLTYSEDLTKQRILWSIFLHWCVTVTLGLPGAIVHIYYGYNIGLLSCSQDRSRLPEIEGVILFLAFAPSYLYLIPFVIMIRMNYVTVKIAVRETKLIFAEQAAIRQAHRNQGEEAQDGTSTLMDNLKKKLNQHRAAKDGLYIIGAFLVCFFPTYLVSVVKLRVTDVPPAVLRFCLILAVFNSACNPIIYSIRKRAFRKAMKRFFLRRHYKLRN